MRITLFYGKWDANINCLTKFCEYYLYLLISGLTELESIRNL